MSFQGNTCFSFPPLVLKDATIGVSSAFVTVQSSPFSVQMSPMSGLGPSVSTKVRLFLPRFSVIRSAVLIYGQPANWPPRPLTINSRSISQSAQPIAASQPARCSRDSISRCSWSQRASSSIAPGELIAFDCPQIVFGHKLKAGSSPLVLPRLFSSATFCRHALAFCSSTTIPQAVG